MADRNKKLIEQSLFLDALSLAKAIAKRHDETSLSVRILLAGFAKAIETNKAKTEYQALVKKKKAILSSIADLSAVIDDDIEPMSEIKFPISDELKKLISNSEGDVQEFVDQLIGQLNGDKAINSPIFNQIIAYASFIAGERKEIQISAELFSASAFLAFRQGTLNATQSLSGYFLANRNAFETLISELAISQESAPNSNQSILPLADNIILAVREVDTDGNAILAVLDVGLSVGTAIISRIATAYHEAGHAVVSAILNPAVNILGVTVVKSDNYDGLTTMDGNNPSSFYQKSTTVEDLHTELAVDLAGRAAQLIKFGSRQIDAGASSDIKEATYQTWRYIALFGLDPEIGPINLEVIGKLQGEASGKLFDLVQLRVQAILKDAADRAETLLRANWDQVEAVTKALLEKKNLSDDDFARNLALTDLKTWDGVKRARSFSVERTVVFAISPGILQTPEGPVRYNLGDAIVSDGNGQIWPVGREYFEKHYLPMADAIYGTDGTYTKIVQAVLVFQLVANRRLDLYRGRGVLFGQKDDWIVEYSDNEHSIISKDQFSQLYEIIV